MGKNNRFREDALKYWDIKCEDAWNRFEEAVRENPYLTAKEFCFVPKKATGLYPYKGISLTFPDGVNLSLQECTAEGLSSLLDIYNKRKEESVCSH